jgi:hypothetical protein
MVKNHRYETLIVIIFFLMLFLSRRVISCHAQSSIIAPSWLHDGTYAEYSFHCNGVASYNSTIVSFDNKTYTTFRWDCIEMNNTTAKLAITVKGTSTNTDDSLLFTTYVHVNILNRAVYLENGTLIGTTHLWLPANPSSDEHIVLWDVPPDKVVLSIVDRPEYAETCQGIQKTFTVSGLITGLKAIGGGNMSYLVMCDFDTGVMVDWGSQQGDNEGTLKALGIMLLLVDGRFLFTDTNIDLGPSYSSMDSISLLVVLLFPITFCLIFVAVYMRRRKKRRLLLRHA